MQHLRCFGHTFDSPADYDVTPLQARRVDYCLMPSHYCRHDVLIIASSDEEDDDVDGAGGAAYKDIGSVGYMVQSVDVYLFLHVYIQPALSARAAARILARYTLSLHSACRGSWVC